MRSLSSLDIKFFAMVFFSLQVSVSAPSCLASAQNEPSSYSLKPKFDSKLGLPDPKKNREAIKLPSNLIPVPMTRQATDYTCGVAAMQSLFAYYGDEFTEMPLAKLLKSNFRYGTAYKSIESFSKEKGYSVEIHKEMTLEQLKQFIDKKQPVLCLVQAWASVPTDYRTEWKDGHYVVAVGYDEKNIFFMDPSTLGDYAYIPVDEFLERWHDTDGHERLHHFGMIVLKDKIKYEPGVATFME